MRGHGTSQRAPTATLDAGEDSPGTLTGRRRAWPTALLLLGGCVLTGLGVLWALQGAGVIHLRPILCVSGCAPVTGFAPTWLVTGFVSLVAGVALLVAGLVRTTRKGERRPAG